MGNCVMTSQADDKSAVQRHIADPVNSAQRRKPLYEARKKIFPKRAEGQFRRFKWIIMLVTLAIYYLTPWLRWDRGEFAPNQAVLIDIAERRFYFFFIEIWPQEFIYVAGLLVMAGFGLFLITSTVGRAWCGYSCPQTVWVDLFLWVERAIEGDRNARMRLDLAPYGFDKLRKRITKHAIWLLIAVLTGGAWIFYFADAPSLLQDVLTGEAAMVAYVTVGILTATTYVFGGLMREQVCTYMCPWPRIQAAMLDEKSLVVTYNDWRGEPRSRHVKKAMAEGEPIGDCVDCNACVAVCPMGIDIREGQQMECITCALCIDACDGVMDKLGKERGLISYATLSQYDANMAIATDYGAHGIVPAKIRGDDGKLKPSLARLDLRDIFRPRTILYLSVFLLVGLGMLISLMTRERLALNVLHDRNPQFVIESSGAIRNGYMLRILNMVPQPRTMRLSIEGIDDAVMKINALQVDQTRVVELLAEPDQATSIKVFVTRPKDAMTGTEENFRFVIEDVDGDERAEYQTSFKGPEKSR
jgi:cytochrome c oxidase accessory protein FixG